MNLQVHLIFQKQYDNPKINQIKIYSYIFADLTAYFFIFLTVEIHMSFFKQVLIVLIVLTISALYHH